MPSEPTLSERIRQAGRNIAAGMDGPPAPTLYGWADDILKWEPERSARLVAAYEAAGPEVAHLLQQADEVEREVEVTDTGENVAHELRAHAAALVKLAETEAKLARARGLAVAWMNADDMPNEFAEVRCARELTAALADPATEGTSKGDTPDV